MYRDARWKEERTSTQTHTHTKKNQHHPPIKIRRRRRRRRVSKLGCARSNRLTAGEVVEGEEVEDEASDRYRECRRRPRIDLAPDEGVRRFNKLFVFILDVRSWVVLCHSRLHLPLAVWYCPPNTPASVLVLYVLCKVKKRSKSNKPTIASSRRALTDNWPAE